MDNAEAEQLVIMEAVRSDRSPTGVQGVPTCMYINLMVCGLKPQTHQLIVDSRLQHPHPLYYTLVRLATPLQAKVSIEVRVL